MAVKYRLDFSTDAGSRKKWRLDILEDGYSGAVLSAKGGSQPIDISWDNQNDAYSPIVASTASIRLIVDSNQNYSEILSGDYGDYEVILRYEDANTPGTYIDYWCGLVVRESYSEHVTSFPYNVTFKATDGLGLLSRDVVGDVTSEGPVTLLSLIQDSLQQIPLPLELRTFSGINNSSDQELLANTSIDPFAFYGDNLSTRPSHLDRIEDILLGTNQIVFQSHARWYVVNASNYAAAINSGVENITFKRYNTQGVTQADVTENVVRVITNASDSNIRSVHDNLYTELREPFGSVECHIDNIVSRSLNSNISFVLGSGNTATGWEFYGNIPAAFDTDIFQNGSRSVTTGVTATQDVAGNSDRWFGSVPITEWDGFTPLDINFDYRFDFTHTNVTDGEVRYQVIMEIGDDTGGIIFSNIDRWLWDFEANQWHGADSSETDAENFEQRFIGVADSANENSWSSHSVRIGPTWPLRGDNRRFFIRFLSPLAVNNDSVILNNGSGLMTTYIDNIRISYEVNTDDQVFELVDDQLTNTIEYEYNTSISSISTDILYNDLSSETYSRVGVSEDISIERLVLQQRLNDFRNFSKYYRGSFINNSDVPFSIHNKILVNYTGQSETVSTISKTMSFSPRSNIFNYLGRIPNQATDTAATFHDTDVPLTAPTLELGNTTEYSLTIDLSVTDSSSVDISSQFNWDLGAGNNINATISGVPGETKTFPLFITPPTGQLSVLANFATTGTLPSDISVGSFQTRVDGALMLPITLTLPRRPDAGTLSITGSTIDFTPEDSPDVNPGVIVITNSGDDLKNNADGTSSFSYDVSGLPGSVVHFTHHIAPVNSNFQVFGGNFDVTGNGDVNLSNLDATGGPDNVSIDFAYRIPVTGDPTPVTVTGDADAAGIIGINLQEVNVTFGTAPTNTRFHEASNTFTGVPGDTKDYSITIIPDADYQITSVQTPTLPLGIVANGVPYESGENWEIPIQVTIPALTDPYAVVQRAITQRTIAVSEEPYSLTFNVNDLGISNAMIPAADAVHRITFNEGDFGDSISPFVINVNPVSGSMFTSSADVAVDVNESSVVIADGSTITLPEAQFFASRQVINGAITITVSGAFPSMGGQYTLDVNIVGNNNEGGAVQSPATTATLTRLTPGISCLGGSGSFELVTNGRWLAEVDTDFFTDAVNSGDGSFTESFTLPSGTWNIGGSYSPYRGESGEQSITLSANPQPFETAGSGATPFFNTSLDGRLRYTISIYSQNINGSRGSLLTTATIDQHQDYGPGEATVPAGYLDSTMVTISTATGYNLWTFNRPS